MIGLLLDIGNVIFFISSFPQLISIFKNRKQLKGLSRKTPFGYIISTLFFIACGFLSNGYLTMILGVINVANFSLQIYWASGSKFPVKFEIEPLEKSGWTGMTVKEMLWDLKKQMGNLDTRETILQKNLAVIMEQVSHLTFQKKEKREEKKISLSTKALAVSILALVITIIMSALELMKK